jgi:hypothetical protein
MRPRPAAPTALLPACLLALAALLAAAPAPARAWGKPAHRLVAGLAEAQLRPGARAEMARLLAPEGAAHLADVASWADEVRSAGGAQARDTRRWHFVNFGGPGCEYAPPRDCPDGDCVVAAINRQYQRLADRRLPEAGRAEALKWLVHLVADVHQPLHATPRALRGGLDYQVEWRGKGRNLHLFWDLSVLDRALEASALDEAGYLRGLQAQPPLPADPTAASDRRAADWAQASCRLIAGESLQPAAHAIGDDYPDAHRARLDMQLRLAGARLADMLNLALDPAPAAAR